MEAELNRLYKKLWETKGSRFIAAKRLEVHAFYSHLTISALSVYIICLNLTVLFESRPPILSNNMITYSTICLSIFMLVIATIISSKGYKEKALKFHDCARSISQLYDNLCLIKNGTNPIKQDQIEEIQKEYHNIINKYDLNHSTLDFLNFKAQNIEEYEKVKHPNFFVFKTWVKSIFSIYFVYYLLLTIPLYFILLLILYT